MERVCALSSQSVKDFAKLVLTALSSIDRFNRAKRAKSLGDMSYANVSKNERTYVQRSVAAIAVLHSVLSLTDRQFWVSDISLCDAVYHR